MKLQFKPSFRPTGEQTKGFWPLQLTTGMSAQGETVWTLRVFYRRLLVAFAVLFVSGWLLAATGLFYWLNQTPHNQVGWFDLAAPWRWPGLRAKRGDTAVLTALDDLKARDYTNAFFNLRVGLARSPGNVDGRLALTRLTAGYEPAKALALMEEGIPLSGGDPKFLAGLLSLYTGMQIQAHALRVFDGLLQNRGATLAPEARFVVERARVVLLLQLGRFAEAGQTLQDIRPAAAEQAAWQALQIEFLLRSDRAADARRFCDEHPAANQETDVRLRQEAEIAIALDDADGLRGTLLRLKANAPDRPAAYLFSFQAWHRLKRLSYQNSTEQEYYRVFGGNEGALQALAALAVNLDLPEIVSRAQQVAVAARRSPFAFRVHLTEIALRRGDPELATRRLWEWENSVDTLKNLQRFYPEFIKRLTRAAFTGTPDQVDYLLAHLTASRGQAQLPAWLLAIKVLETSGIPAGAGQILAAALRLYPESDPLLAARQKVDAQLSALTAAAAAVKPVAPDPLLPATGAEVLRRMDELLQQDALAAARDLLRSIRAQKPAWLTSVEPAIALREVELAFMSLDPIAARGVARSYLDRNRNEETLLPLVELVARLVARGRVDDARVLADEIAAVPSATVRVLQALQSLNLADDLAIEGASQASALAAFDRWIRNEQWAQAERLLKHLRDKPPAWLTGDPVELKEREVQVRLGLGQRPQAFAVLKDLVIKGGAARSVAFKLVRDRLAAGQTDSAVALAREILRLMPDDPAARRLLKETETPRPAE